MMCPRVDAMQLGLAWGYHPLLLCFCLELDLNRAEDEEKVTFLSSLCFFFFACVCHCGRKSDKPSKLCCVPNNGHLGSSSFIHVAVSIDPASCVSIRMYSRAYSDNI
jgi:hypothetical protein